MEGKTRYYLIACGTSNYKNTGEYGLLPSVETDIKLIVDLFTKKFGYKRVLTDVGLNPQKETLITKFADWLQHEERCETDIVIFYYSGHGEDAKGGKHYLVMEDTNPKQVPQTALATEDLVRPLINEGVKISQILYIIDTCYSQSGAGDITEFALQVIQKFAKVEGKNGNIAVHTIAACRVKQTAEQQVFSQALKKILEDSTWTADNFKGGYIYPSDLVPKINDEISSFATQRVVYSISGCETSIQFQFLPILPRTWQTWEEHRPELIEELLRILNKQLDHSLLFINSFLLSSKFIEEFVLDEPGLKDKLTYLASLPVSDGICPLIACSEWCKRRFSDSDQKKINIAKEIENWQGEVIKYRKEVEKYKIQENVGRLYDDFQKRIDNENLRIQIEIEPEKDQKNNTGRLTGALLFNMNLWIESQKLPLGRFAENVVLEPQENGQICLRMCLKKENFLSDLIRQARYSLTESVKPTIEIFLPLFFYQEHLEKICFPSGRNQKELGKEYQIFINSFERYFDEDFREIRDEIYEKKKTLWKNDHKNDNNLDSDVYYIGTDPSTSDLEKIEEALPIAVWSRNHKKPLVEGDKGHIKISEWKQWPEKIHNLRKQNQDLEITLFWDDLYPKPSRRCRPLNTKVVE